MAYEIICLDDASSSKYLEYYNEIKKELKIQWLSTTKNIGRSSARNTLARQANYETILFLDCDVILPDDHFITRYIPYLKQNKIQAVYGSCSYESDQPSDKRFLLHWIYGTKKENPPLKVRIKNPYDTFHSVNFLVKKKTVLSNPFDESISKYGYEDSLWANALKSKNIAIEHIDNPVLHKGIHPTKQFLRKTAAAIHNLIYLEKNSKSVGTKLFKTLERIRSIGLETFAFKLYQWNEKKIVRNLFSDHPSLFYFSIYKLGLCMRFRKKH
jgi:glycosyltransferase involved in cell wall biosynthesis